MAQTPEQLAKHQQILERRIVVSDLLKSGLTQRKIHRALQGTYPCSLATVNADIKAMFTELTKVSVNRVAEARELDVSRIDALLAAIWAAAMNGDADKVRAAIQLLQRRAKMFGYDAPTEIRHAGSPEAPPIQIVYRNGPQVDLTKLTEDDLDALERIVQQQKPEVEDAREEE